MVENNHWHASQPRSYNSRFAPKWDKDTIIWIDSQLKQSVSYIDIQYQLHKQYSISLDTASLWIEMARRVMVDVSNGIDMESAIELDRERRNAMRRKKTQ